MARRILLVASDIFVQRLAPSLGRFVGRDLDFGIVGIERSLSQLRRLIQLQKPSALVTEWLSDRTEAVLELGIPTVIVDTDICYPKTVSLDVDDHQVGENAARFFAEAGYNNYGCIFLEAPYGQQRRIGYENHLNSRRFVSNSFLQPQLDDLQYMESSFQDTRKLRAWLRDLPKPVAIFAVHDPLGRLVCETALAIGMLVPDEVAVLGANDDPLVCGLRFPPLSSISIPWDQLGALAGKWARSLARGRSAPRCPLLVPPGPIAIRQSTTSLAVNDAMLRRFLQHLRDHFRENISVDSVCRDLRISRRMLERKFEEHLQISPRKQLVRMRVDAAKMLLYESNDAMSEIAEACGFSNSEQFSVTFRQHTGQTPNNYRRQRTGSPFDLHHATRREARNAPAPTRCNQPDEAQ